MSVAALKLIDSGLSSAVTVGTVGTASYCLKATVGGKDARFLGPGGTVTQTAATCT